MNRPPPSPPPALPAVISSSTSSDATTQPQPWVHYPATLHPLSPTLTTWVRLSCALYNRLSAPPSGFEGQPLLFHLNHPIRYVRLVGVVVAMDSYERRTVLIIDDGSGANVEVVHRHSPRPMTTVPAQPAGKVQAPRSGGQHRTASEQTLNGIPETTGTGTISDRHAAHPEDEINLEKLGIDIGTVVKVKGEVCEGYYGRQVVLKRIQIVRSTGDEVKAWEELNESFFGVLSKPWMIEEDEKMAFLESQRRRKTRKTSVKRRPAGHDGSKMTRESERKIQQKTKDVDKRDTMHKATTKSRELPKSHLGPTAPNIWQQEEKEISRTRRKTRISKAERPP